MIAWFSSADFSRDTFGSLTFKCSKIFQCCASFFNVQLFQVDFYGIVRVAGIPMKIVERKTKRLLFVSHSAFPPLSNPSYDRLYCFSIVIIISLNTKYLASDRKFSPVDTFVYYDYAMHMLPYKLRRAK